MFKAINEFLHRASEGAEQRRISRTLDRPSRGNADTGAFVDLYLTLPDRWRPGLAPGRGDASRIADPDLVALAYDGRYREHDAPGHRGHVGGLGMRFYVKLHLREREGVGER